MRNPLTQNTQNRKSIINPEINAQVKKYQQELVKLSFSQGDVSNEYNDIVNKIQILRNSVFEENLNGI